ncbi:MAG: AMP-binding protein [Stagnimonas sp.]|nr:AMP-binding protein [Stagnimonas sp.]
MLDLIQWRARKTPESPALFFNGRWYTFRDMEGRANRLANRLRSLGIQRGDRVSVIAHNHLVHFDLLLAAPKIGIVYAPLNPHLSAQALAAQAALVKPAMVFVDSRHHASAAALGVQWARLSEYRDWLVVGSLDVPPPPALSVDDPHIFYGTPRGVAVLPYRQVLLNARHSADAWQLSAQDSTVHCLPCFGPELNLLCLPILYRGGRVVLMSGFDTDEYLGHLALHRITVSALTPFMLRQLTEYGDFDEADLSSLNWFASVGSPAPLPVRQALLDRGLKVRTLYPIAEAGPNLFNATLDDVESRPELLGLPLPDVQLMLQDADGSTVTQGDAGQLLLSGPMVFSGALQAADVAIEPAPTPFASGIAVVQDADGQYLYRGRSEEAFVSRGTLIYPGEIEAALLQLESVMDCAVAGVADGNGDLAILASVVFQDGVQRDDASLAAALSNYLPETRVPAFFHRSKMLPRDAWGVVRRDLLVQQFGQLRAR